MRVAEWRADAVVPEPEHHSLVCVGFGRDVPRWGSHLVAYYDNEVKVRAARELPPQRVAHRAEFVELVMSEGRGSVLEIGSGPGRDGQGFTDAGLAYVGVDLSPVAVAHCRSLGLQAVVASVLRLPFRN